MTKREFAKAHQTGAFKQAVVHSTTGNKFFVLGQCANGEGVILTRTDTKVRLFRKIDTAARVLHDLGFQDIRLDLAKWSPAQSALTV